MRLRLLTCCALLLCAALAHAGAPLPTAGDYAIQAQVFGAAAVAQEPTCGPPVRSSFYLPMRDGVRIAVDLHLPERIARGDCADVVPAVVRFTRYWRSLDLLVPDGWAARGLDLESFLPPYGYAVLDVDVRGTGASFGVSSSPWSADETQDYREVIDWASRQPWSSGTVAAVGVSYVGTAAEFAAAASHPALKAVMPMFSLWDAYADIAFPGGVFNDGFVRQWGRFNAILDANALPPEAGSLARLGVRGVRPADADPSRELLAQAVTGHAANLDLYAAARAMTFRDDRVGPSLLSADDFSPHRRAAQAQAGGAAVYSWGGWFDGAYARSLINRFRTLANPQRAVIGPWNHGAEDDASPYRPQRAPVWPPPLVQLLEQKRFLDHWLKGLGERPAQEVRYFTLGEERWKSSPTWPPAGVESRSLYLGPRRALAGEPPATAGQDRYRVDFTVGSGRLNRWNTQLNRADVAYPDRARVDRRLLTYDSPPLAEDLEIAGEPTLDMWLASTAADGAVFAYLEDVAPDGRVRMLTEGCLRLLHRRESAEARPYPALGPWRSFRRADAWPMVAGQPARVRFNLLPVSALVRRGSRLRLALAGHDQGQFARLPDAGAPVWAVHRGGGMASRLELPVMPR